MAIWNRRNANPTEPNDPAGKRLSLEQAIQIYMDDRRKAGRRWETIRSYQSHISGFQRFIRQTCEREISVVEAAELIGDYLAYRAEGKNCWDDNPCVATQDKRLSMASVAVTYRTLRAFFNRLQELDYLCRAENPFALGVMACPSTDDKIPVYLREEEIHRVLQLMRESTMATRNVALFFLLLDTGARIGEILQARLRDLNLEGGLLRVIGKRRRYREIPFTSVTAQHLQEYLKTREKQTPEDPLFLKHDGQPLTYNAVRMLLNRVFAQAGIDVGRNGPHVFRHTFGRMYLKYGGDLSTLQQILGHTMISTTTIYARMLTPDLQSKHQICSPVLTLFGQSTDDPIPATPPDVTPCDNGASTPVGDAGA